MKRHIAKIMLITLLVGTAGMALADTSINVSANAEASTSDSSGIVGKLKSLFETKKDIQAQEKSDIEEVKADAQNQIQADRTSVEEQVTENRFSKMNARLQATIDRLTNIMARVNTRIAKIKAAGGDTTAAENFVAEAKTNLDAAQAEMATLKTTTDTEVSLEANSTSTVGATLKSNLAGLRSVANDIQSKLQASRNFLSKAVGNLLGVSTTLKVQENASTTNEQ